MITITHLEGVETFYYSAQTNGFVPWQPILPPANDLPSFYELAIISNNELYLEDQSNKLFLVPFSYDTAIP